MESEIIARPRRCRPAQTIFAGRRWSVDRRTGLQGHSARNRARKAEARSASGFSPTGSKPQRPTLTLYVGCTHIERMLGACMHAGNFSVRAFLKLLINYGYPLGECGLRSPLSGFVACSASAAVESSGPPFL